MVFFSFIFDNTTSYFLNPHFSLCLHDKYSVIISKLYYESIIHLELIIFKMTPTKFIAKWIIKKLIMLVFNMILHFKSIYILQKNLIIII
jgi:hypothetical protein